MSTSFDLDLARAVMDARTRDIAAAAQGRRRVVVRRRQRRAQRSALRLRWLPQAG